MDRYNTLKYAMPLLGALALSGCESAKRIHYDTPVEANVSSAKDNARYVQQEGILDAAEADRETRCVKGLEGIVYPNAVALYTALDGCVASERRKDMYKNIGIAVVADGVKLYLTLAGLIDTAEGPSTPVPPVPPVPKTTIGIGVPGRVLTPIIK